MFCDLDAVRRLIRDLHPDIIANVAAYTAVDPACPDGMVRNWLRARSNAQCSKARATESFFHRMIMRSRQLPSVDGRAGRIAITPRFVLYIPVQT
jgi:hypothetical protein